MSVEHVVGFSVGPGCRASQTHVPSRETRDCELRAIREGVRDCGDRALCLRSCLMGRESQEEAQAACMGFCDGKAAFIVDSGCWIGPTDCRPSSRDLKRILASPMPPLER